MRRGVPSTGALEEMPLKLMIMAIVLAITVPIVADSLQNFSRDQVEMNVEAELSKLITAVKISYSSGVGTSIPVTVTFENGIMCSIEYIRIGDAPGRSYESIVRYKLTDQPRSFVPVEPYIPMTGEAEDENGGGAAALELGAGSHRLMAVHEIIDGRDAVRLIRA